MSGETPLSLDDILTAKVVAAVEQALAPYADRLADPEPLTYTIPEAAKRVGVSRDTFNRWVRRGLIPLVPHIEGHQRVSRVRLERFLAGEGPVAPADVA